MLHLGVGTLLFCVFLAQCTILSSFAKESHRTSAGSHVSEYKDYLTIVCTVDGGLHGIDKYGNKAWSSSTGNPMLSAQNYAAQDTDEDDDDGDVELGKGQLGGIIKRKGYSILPSTDGTLIYHSVTDGMRKTSVTARLLVEQTPFVSGEGISFTGRKSSRLLKLDANTGTILFDSAAENFPAGGEPEVLKTIDGAVNPVWVGRIDYSLEAVDTTTGRQEFNFTYSEFVPLPYGSQYEYGDAQGAQRQQDRGQNVESAPEEEFEVATDVQLGEAEVVQLLGARAAAGWDSDDGDEISPSIDESQGIVDASFDLGVEPSTSTERTAVRQTRVGKVKRKRGGRRRRKNRVGMEKRAATVSSKSSIMALSEPLRKIELPDAEALTLISTPDGELYFSDREGIVLEKVPIKLQSPVFSAFKLQRTYDGGARGEEMTGSLPLAAGSLSYEDSPSGGAESGSSSGGDRWGVRSINVMHRVLTYTGTDADSNVVLSQNGLTVAGEVAPSSDQQVNRIIVQSPSATEKDLLYVLEVAELEMSGEDPALAKGLSIGNSADGTVDTSAFPTKRELRAQARAELRQRQQQQQQQRVQSQNSAPAPVSALSASGLRTKTSEEDFSHKALKRPGTGIGAGSGVGPVGRRILSPPQHRKSPKGLVGVGSLRLLDKVEDESSSGALFGANSLTLSWEEDKSSDTAESPQLVRKDIRVCLPRVPSFYFPVSWIPGVNISLQNACPVHSLKQLRDSNEPSARHVWGEDGVIIDLDDDGDDESDNENENEIGDAGHTFDPASDNEVVMVRDAAGEKKNSGMRGSHVLRPDLYEGSLFQSDSSQLNLDAHMHLFRGVLHHSHNSPQPHHSSQRPPTGPATGGSPQGRQHQQSNWGSWQRGGASADRSGSGAAPSEPMESYLPVVAKAHPLSWMDVFALKVFAIVEHLLLYLVAVAIVTALIFMLGVYFVRSSSALAHLLPPDIAFSSQLHFALHALVGRALLLFLPSAQVPIVTAPLASQQPKLVSRGSSSKIALMMTGEESLQAESTNRELKGSVSSVDVPVTTTAFVPQAHLVTQEQQLPPPSPAPAVVTTSSAVSTAEEELVDAEGKRQLRVGNLIVHCEHILGYGSHGTTVYRGSLDGRPLAVKRILTQFVRSADREISLLIRSDGHANVVRYFTKEQKSDFVYLGLQLCDMTLKDFVVQVRECSSTAIVEGGNTSIPTVEITEAVKGGLLQIAMGVAHLHAHRIVHRDIKPQNILLARVADTASAGSATTACGTTSTDEQDVLSPTSLNDLSSYVLKISDMGLSKQLGRDHGSFSSMSLSIAAGHSTARIDPRDMFLESVGEAEEGPARSMAVRAAAVGTVGWQAPELISHRYVKEDLSSPSPRSGSTGPSEFTQNIVFGDDVPLASQEDTQDSEVEGERDEVTPIVSVATQLRRDRKKRTLTVDVFSLGCVFYFTITQGEHPFGQWFEREANIAAGKMSLASVQHDPLAVDLLTWMLAADPLMRPTSSEVCGHPFFWTAASKLHFLVEFSDRMEHEPADSPMVLAVEAGALTVLGSRWDRRLDVLLLEDLGKFRKYDTTSVRDLLRVMRNKRHHFHELSLPLKEAIGSIPDGFMNYFDVRFPQLVLHCAYVAHRYLSGESLFRPWARGTRSCSAVVASSTQKQVVEDIRAAGEALPPAQPLVSSELVSEKKLSIPSERTSSASSVDNVVVWQGSALSSTLQCGGWWRSASDWVAGPDAGAAKKNRASHLTKSAADPKYRISLCSHWEETNATVCPMRKKGKCVFAHGPLELRVKEARRGKWNGGSSSTTEMAASGGEDVLGAARNVSRARAGGGTGTEAAGVAGAVFEMEVGKLDNNGKQQQVRSAAQQVGVPSTERAFHTAAAGGNQKSPFAPSRYQPQQQPQQLRGGALPYQPFVVTPPPPSFGQHAAGFLSEQQFVAQQFLQHQQHQQQQGVYCDETAHAYAYALQQQQQQQLCESTYDGGGANGDYSSLTHYDNNSGSFYHPQQQHQHQHQQDYYPPS